MIELLRLALRNIGKRKKRTALTLLGIFIGISAVVALISLGQGLQKTVNAQLEKVGADKIIIQAKEVGYGGEFAPGQLKERELEIIRKTHGVTTAAGNLFRAQQVVFNNIQRPLTLLSLPEHEKEAELTIATHTVELETGRLLRGTDRQKATVGYNLAFEKLFGRNIEPGDKIQIGKESFAVVGVQKHTGDPTMDASIMLSEEDLRRIVNDTNSYSMLIAQAAPGTNPEEVAGRIEKDIRRDRHQKEGKEDFVVQTSTELIASFNTVLNIIQFVFVGIASISLFVGGIGIMNTMYTAVLERTREIGVMKAIGARNSDILTIFLIESALLGIAGGLVGMLIGIGISKTVEMGANAAFGAGTITAIFPWYLLVGTILFAAIVGMISGSLPARRASKLKPVEALRYE
ncbi:MAG TPA: ABC transporter permease [Candidatus Nanoarchaeia archaeon]|nr:ABC transporter permease [Candidatus Nanoarchaeia archaeon]